MTRVRPGADGFASALAISTLFAMGAACPADLRVLIKDQRGKPVEDAVVLAAPVDPKSLLHATPPTDAVDQVNKQFSPYVTPVYVGSKVRFPNKDNIRHQVYSFSPAKRFELPLYAGTEAPPVVFDTPGVVVMGCNIHDWMIGYVYVSETPFFAKTGGGGAATLENLPPGEYLVRLWHPNMQQPEGTTVKRVMVNDAGQSLEWQITLKPNFRVPRSGSVSPGYP